MHNVPFVPQIFTLSSANPTALAVVALGHVLFLWFNGKDTAWMLLYSPKKTLFVCLFPLLAGVAITGMVPTFLPWVLMAESMQDGSLFCTFLMRPSLPSPQKPPHKLK